MIEAKAFRIFIRIYSLFKCKRLSANIKIIYPQGTDQIYNDLRLSCLGISVRSLPLKIAVHEKEGSVHYCKFCKVHTGPRFARDLHTAFNIPYVNDYVAKLCIQKEEEIQNHENEHVRNTGQGEARHRGLNFGGGEAYDRSSD
jgi:hypothetical protein